MATIDRRKTQQGEERFRARVRRRGIAETASFSTRSEAETWAREVDRAIESGRWTVVPRGGGFTVGWILDRYLAHRRPGRDAKRQLEWWRRHLSAEAAVEVSRRKILGLRRRLLSETNITGRQRSSATVNRYMAALSGLFSWALRGEYLDYHPMKGIEPLPESTERLRCLTPNERQALIVSCRETGGLRLETLVVLGLSTGARRGELLDLCWSDLDISERQVNLRGKGRLKKRTLPLPESAIGLLRKVARVRRIDSNRIFAEFGGRVQFPRAAWKAALERAEISDFRFHDLRHSAAAYLAKSGASLPEIAAILGTRTLKGVLRYSPLTAARAPSAISRMQDDLFES